MSTPNQLDSFWMPFTANRDFKKSPRLLSKADGMYYTSTDGRSIMDGTAGLWCCNAGHNRKPIVEAIQNAAETLDYAPTFQMGHPDAFEFANRLTGLLPDEYNHAFFTNSGSESVDTALKIALAYHRARGQGQRTRLIGRERGYHGVGFGGISVGGISPNRVAYGSLLPGVDHLPHTHDLARNAFSRGCPDHGVEKANALEDIIALHDPSNIAAVIVEPLAGSTGVLLPPKGYLKKLREICSKHGILLIFDEVITGFGRLGEAFATQFFDVKPDIITMAKGLTSGTVPAGAVIVQDHIHDAFMQGPEGAIELFHGYTYSAHPLACAAGIATLELYKSEGLLTRAATLSQYWENAVHNLKGERNIIDIRNLGLVAGIELEPREGEPGKRAFEIFKKAYDKGALIRTTGDIIALSPPLIIEEAEIDKLVGIVREAVNEVY